jgi:4-hydroxy-3-methylbut-2-en-1-yl diphosphate reductase
LQDIEETQFVCDYIAGKHTREEFFATFHPNAMSKGFNPDEDLQSIGIANQTTMLKVRACALQKHNRLQCRHAATSASGGRGS